MPKSIAWKITENCNSRCRTCSHWRTHVDDELTFKECKIVINKCVEDGINSFRLTGGDPSLRKDLPKIIAYIHGKHGFVSVNSNLINIENIPLEIENLFVPLDGTRATYRELRGVDAFNKVCENLTYFTEYSEANIVVTVILMKQTINDITLPTLSTAIPITALPPILAPPIAARIVAALASAIPSPIALITI